MPSPRAFSTATALVWLSACAPATAIIDGKEVPRLTQEFVGQPYTIRHSRAHPRPGGASSSLRSPGGVITGVVCGADVNFQVEHKGDHIQLAGFLDPGAASQISVDVHLRVEDKNGQRAIMGQVGTQSVDLRLRPNELVGWVGAGGVAVDGFTLRQTGDDMVGQLRLRRHQGQTINIKLTGRDALWALPAADQGIVVPLILLCLQFDPGFQRGNDPQLMGFGGHAGAVPRGTLGTLAIRY